MTPRDYALLAKLAYSAKPTIGSINSSARAVVWPENVIGFPGTDNLECWLTDLDALIIDVEKLGKLHRGFWEAFQTISKPVVSVMPKILLGHSLGAALAILSAAQLCINGNPPDAVYAFEPPKVSADNILSDLFKSCGVKLYLYHNGGDIVPMLPHLFEHWQHPSELISIGKIKPPNVEDHFIEKVIASLGDMDA